MLMVSWASASTPYLASSSCMGVAEIFGRPRTVRWCTPHQRSLGQGRRALRLVVRPHETPGKGQLAGSVVGAIFAGEDQRANLKVELFWVGDVVHRAQRLVLAR